MSLIINEQAVSDFTSESVDSNTVMYLFNDLIGNLNSIAVLTVLTFDENDPSMPTWLNSQSQTIWKTYYDGMLNATNDSNIDRLNTQCFSDISSLFYVTNGKSLSRQDVIDQLTSTLSAYDNAAVNSFFASIQLS